MTTVFPLITSCSWKCKAHTLCVCLNGPFLGMMFSHFLRWWLSFGAQNSVYFSVFCVFLQFGMQHSFVIVTEFLKKDQIGRHKNLSFKFIRHEHSVRSSRTVSKLFMQFTQPFQEDLKNREICQNHWILTKNPSTNHYLFVTTINPIRREYYSDWSSQGFFFFQICTRVV